MKVSFLYANPTKWYKKIGAAILRWSDKSDYAHFAILIEYGQSEFVYESILPVSQRLNKYEWLGHYRIQNQITMDVPKYLEKDVLIWSSSMVGKPYSLAQLVLISMLLLFAPLRRILFMPILNHDKALICTEMGSRFIERFMTIKLEKSHDEIGLRDMVSLGRICPKWIGEKKND